MKYDMVMPKMGESITEGTIIKWLKQIGDTVEKDEIVLEISTDKVDSEIPTPVSGKIVEFLANENDTIEVGKVIARIDTEGEAESMQPQAEAPPAEEVEEPVPAEEPAKTETPPVQEPAATDKEEKPESKKFFSPVVLNIARSEGVSAEEMESIEGSGISGRVTKKDILNFIETRKSGTTAPAAAAPLTVSAPVPSSVISEEGVEIIPMDHIRKKIAEHMVHTVHTAAHVGLYIEVDMFNVYRIRENSKNNFYRKEGIKLTFMPFLSEAVVKTLKEFPLVNASIEDDNIIVKHFINLGIAVDTEKGLIVPVIKNAESLNLTGIARAINDLASRTRNRKLKPDEVSGGTFSISNFGVFRTKIGFPLINQPQVAILGVGALEKRAIVVNDAIAIRPMMNISLTFDHRLIDGALGARFLQRLKEHLELYDPELQL
ncbi:MAG: 2-oxo acid dehydrogenase subunit E2 [Calditrichia bacterium]|nr:2-oxo acid dehydrogenase subunit E2 [Calditrichia bacterium]